MDSNCIYEERRRIYFTDYIFILDSVDVKTIKVYNWLARKESSLYIIT